jgi:hypothetical protein
MTMPGLLGNPSTGYTDRTKGKGIVEAGWLARIGKGGALAAGGGNLFSAVPPVAVGNGADTTEDVLFSASLPANTLDIIGRCITLQVWGSISATNAVKTAKIYFGASIVFTPVLITPAAATTGIWQAYLQVFKTGPSTQSALLQTDFAGSTLRNIFAAVGTENDAAPILVKATGQSSVGTANTVTAMGFVMDGYD